MQFNQFRYTLIKATFIFTYISENCFYFQWKIKRLHFIKRSLCLLKQVNFERRFLFFVDKFLLLQFLTKKIYNWWLKRNKKHLFWTFECFHMVDHIKWDSIFRYSKVKSLCWKHKNFLYRLVEIKDHASVQHVSWKFDEQLNYINFVFQNFTH